MPFKEDKSSDKSAINAAMSINKIFVIKHYKKVFLSCLIFNVANLTKQIHKNINHYTKFLTLLSTY